MRGITVVANWKMFGNRASSVSLLESVVQGVCGKASSEIIVCPPSIYVDAVSSRLKALYGSKVSNRLVKLGAQNVHFIDEGAYTGEISVPMLEDFDCDYVLLGHSERRSHAGEQDSLIKKKLDRTLNSAIQPILCVGETKEQREQDLTHSIVGNQLAETIELVPSEHWSKMLIAYEPRWAIGTGLTATPDQAQTVHEYIRDRLSKIDPVEAKDIRILYGGSVKAANAANLFSMPDIDGGLVGGASLHADEFINICLC